MIFALIWLGAFCDAVPPAVLQLDGDVVDAEALVQQGFDALAEGHGIGDIRGDLDMRGQHVLAARHRPDVQAVQPG